MARSPSADRSTANPLLYVFMNTMVATVRSDKTDLTARQLAVFLKTYLESGDRTHCSWLGGRPEHLETCHYTGAGSAHRLRLH